MGLIFILIAVAAAGWFWNDTLRARERVLMLCQQACAETNVQLLDETVALKRLGSGRGSRGHLTLRRTYQFEFSIDGQDRRHGRAILLGRKLESLQMDRGDGVTILNGRGGNVVHPRIR
jgi:hypothetical protein